MTIKAQKILMSDNLNYEDVEILSDEEQQAIGIKNYFEDAQIAFKAKEGMIVAPVYNVTYVCLDRSKKTLPPAHSRVVARVTISSEIVQQDAHILDPGASPTVGIPQIYPPQEQFVVACAEGLFVTADYQIVQLHL
jgi:hypothetical protein